MALVTERLMTNVRKFLIQLDWSLWGWGGGRELWLTDMVGPLSVRIH